jgi:hypothetical protein
MLFKSFRTAIAHTLIRVSNQVSGGVYGFTQAFLDLLDVGELFGKHRTTRSMGTHKTKVLCGDNAPEHLGRRPSLINPNQFYRAITVEQTYTMWGAAHHLHPQIRHGSSNIQIRRNLNEIPHLSVSLRVIR